MPQQGHQLDLDRCPHCNVDRPHLSKGTRLETNNFQGVHPREWGFYKCARCGGVVTAWSHKNSLEIKEMFPAPREVNEAVPDRARNYLQQAISSISAPAGSVMLTASSVDAMLKVKGLTEGSLYSRIDEAASSHLITKEMAQWAHEVRLDANDQRHSDTNAPLPTEQDAVRCIDFAQALAMFLFVLPAQVQRGIDDAHDG